LTASGPVSSILRELRDAAPPDRFSLNWLLDSLESRSFAIVLLMLALMAMAPGVSIVAGLLITTLGAQMMAGRAGPAFPRRVAAYTMPTAYLSASIGRLVPVLTRVERIVRPRWATPPQTTQRAVGLVVALLSIAVVFVPIPLSNVAPAFVIALIAVAYLEGDGIFLALALLAGVVLLATTCVLLWEAVLGVKSLSIRL
jgi:hypothetical protein